MKFIEAPTSFYLGRRYDPQGGALTDDVVYYDSRDLTTHAVVLGMTGSGKTGLCITMLEEAILDDIPAIIIDPKGDITNLLLTFPGFQAGEFEPWVNIDDARRANMDVPQFASDQAKRWQRGLADWGIAPDRVRWMQMATKISVFTPGSSSGLPISILASLAAPREGWMGHEEAHREKINAVTTALLALIGIQAEPVKDIEHVLVANIFEHNWSRGVSLTLQDLIGQVQRPPFAQLGTLPVDQAISERARTKLAMALNNIVAAPSFQSWLSGEAMDIERLLYQRNGRPRVSIFYLAHLSDAERMFMMTLILESMIGWMRTKSGTTSLRALLYIDEMFGYFPPYPKNPPTKTPLMTLLKQARAFGLGLILSTQNPGDLDYKGLTNAGTWFIGRLQSDQDRERVRAGLQALSEGGLDMREVEQLIASIPPRVFVMRNVHDSDGATMVHSRWAMSYLRGPLTRQQVGVLMEAQRRELYGQFMPEAQQAAAPSAGFGAPPPPRMPGMPPPPPPPPAMMGGFSAQSAAAPMMPPSPQAAPQASGVTGYATSRPALPSAITQYFYPSTLTAQQAIMGWEQRMGARAQLTAQPRLVYRPVLTAQASVRYNDKKAQAYTSRSYAYLVPDLERAGLVQWDQFAVNAASVSLVSPEPFDTTALFGEMSAGISDSKRLTELKRDFVDMLYGTARLIVPFNPALDIYGHPDEDEAAYEARVRQSAREARDAEIDKVNQKYTTRMDALEQKLMRHQTNLRAEEQEVADLKREEMFTTGEALLSLLRGRTNYTLSRMSRASRYRRQSGTTITENRYMIEQVEQEMEALEQEYESVLKQVGEKWVTMAGQRQQYAISPLKKDIYLELFGVGWLPMWLAGLSGQAILLPAYQA
ncbi:MAG: DUF87 domain-containing protein [Anaerolineae bacterium]|nr:DUF87 domain-containing protein [Anaerolineae bacterium]